MSKDYGELFDKIVAPHFHKLAKIVTPLHKKKLLVHEWVLEIEKNWPEYAYISGEGHEFIARLSFWMGGLRDKFKSDPSKKEVLSYLNETFEASTYCFFEYGAHQAVKEQIVLYCSQIDEWMKEPILKPRLKRFISSHELIPIIETYTTALESYGGRLDVSTFRLSDNVSSSESLELFFKKVIRELIAEYLKFGELHRSNADAYDSLASLVDELNSCGYASIITDKQKHRISIWADYWKKQTNIQTPDPEPCVCEDDSTSIQDTAVNLFITEEDLKRFNKTKNAMIIGGILLVLLMVLIVLYVKS